jgi:hypothetical protein
VEPSLQHCAAPTLVQQTGLSPLQWFSENAEPQKSPVPSPPASFDEQHEALLPDVAAHWQADELLTSEASKPKSRDATTTKGKVDMAVLSVCESSEITPTRVFRFRLR